MGVFVFFYDVLIQMVVMMGVGGIIGVIILSCIVVSDFFQFVVVFYSFVGFVVVLIVIVKYFVDVDFFVDDFVGNVYKVVIFLGIFIGGVIFIGFFVVFGKFYGLLDFCVFSLLGKNLLNIGMVLVNVGVMGWFMVIDSVVVGIFMLGKF